MKELTLELTDYCPYECTFCSSNAGPDKSQFLDIERAKEMIVDTDAQIIHLSGGEPLAHPHFWTILQLAQARVGGRNVRVMSNAIQWLAYNAAVINGIHVEANFTPEPGLDQINVLQRVKQGRERTQPVVKFSRNHDDALMDDDWRMTEREINEIRGKMSVDAATHQEVRKFLRYVQKLEDLVEEVGCEDFYGTDGWRHRFGWDEC